MTLLTLTHKQKELLFLLYRFRFLTISHLQALFHHTDSRRIRLWLKDLQKQNLIQTKYSQENKKNGERAVYFLTVESREILKSIKGVIVKELDKIKREQDRTEEFVEHSLFICDIYIRFCEITQDAKLYFFTKADLPTLSYFFKPYPDEYIAIEENGIVVKRYFLDIFDEKVKRSKIRKRIERYVEYFVTNEWEQETNHPFPSILLIAPDKDMKDYCYRIIKAILEEEGGDISFFVATKKAVKTYGVKKDVWQKVMVE